MKELSVIIPAYNEEKRIRKTLNIYLPIFKKYYKNSFEVIIITDGCKDKTPDIVKKFSKKYKFIKHINYQNRLGKGGAIIEGFKVASGKIVGFLDADGSTSPKSIISLIKYLNKYDGVIASRWIKKSKVVKKQSLSRRIASRIFNFLVRFLFGFNFKDTQCGAKFFRKKAIEDILPEIGLTDWAFDIDLLYRFSKRNYKIKEVPITWRYKEGSKLKLSKTSVKMLLSVLGLRVKCSKFSFIAKSPIVIWIYKIVKNL
ncbi:MAG: glycosyltransferase family 2 protein [Candidatus Aenigmatarchaeota archaeon]